MMVPYLLCSITLYDGETPKTDLNKDNGGPYYEVWWGGPTANSLSDSSTTPYEGKYCLKWECQVPYSGGAFYADPNWIGIKADNVTNIEFWARGKNGGETVILTFFDRNLNKPNDKDGMFPPIVLKDIPNVWTKYSFNVAEELAKIVDTRPPDMNIFEGFTLSGSEGGTVVYFDNIRLGEVPRKEKSYTPIKINKMGWRPDDKKIAILNKDSEVFEIIDAKTGTSVFNGKPVLGMKNDPSSGDDVWYADFSSFKTPGSYQIALSDGTRSGTFKIAEDVYKPIWKDAMKAFYFQRCGTALTKDFGNKYTRPYCHKGDKNAEFAMRNDGIKPEGTMDVSGGWHDAGDDNKYTHPLYITLWYLVNAYLIAPEKFKDNLVNIPESGNGISDLVDEILWETKWLEKMQVKSGNEKGLVYNKVGEIRKEPNADYLQTKRYIFEPTSSDTIVFSATMAMVSYMLEKTQTDENSKILAQRYKKAAISAYDAWVKVTENGARQYPEGGFKNPPGWDGSTAMGLNPGDEKKMALTAAVELYRLTKDSKYHDIVKSKIDEYITLFKSRDRLWGADEFLAFYNYSALPDEMRDPKVMEKMKSTLREFKKDIMKYVSENAYKVPFGAPGHFCWGSNSHLVKNAINFYFLYMWDQKEEDWLQVQRAMNYILGLNAVDKMMFTGRGKAVMYHKYWNKPGQQPPGYMVGGVNQWDGNDYISKYPQKCYEDSNTNWSLTEGGIYYQAAAVFILSLFIP
jgi:endoglucanase